MFSRVRAFSFDDGKSVWLEDAASGAVAIVNCSSFPYLFLYFLVFTPGTPPPPLPPLDSTACGHHIQQDYACRYPASFGIMEVVAQESAAAVTMHMRDTTSAWMSNNTAVQVLKVLHFAYPLILLVFFITTFTAYSIISASNGNDEKEQAPEEHTGPGGKPLPKKTGANAGKRQDVLDFSRPRKLLFEWLALGAALTFVGNAITIIVHALYSRSEQWWCGQATVVSIDPPLL